MVYQFIEQVESEFPVNQLCKLLQVSGSAYYEWTTGQTYQPDQREEEDLIKVKQAFWMHKKRYGTRRLVVELQEMGLDIGRKKVRRLMKTQSLVAIQPEPKILNV